MTERFYEVQGETIKNTMKQLKTHHKCLLVRPTGFGKTKSAVDIMMKYKHAVFLYPFHNIGNAVQQYDVGELDLCMYTYATLRNLYKASLDEFKRIFSKFNLKNTIFVMDEVHFIGAPATGEVIKHLMEEVCPNANFLGITATPNRTDKLEVKWHFFDGITAKEYGLSDAFEDEIFIKPYYVYTPLDGSEIERAYLAKIEGLSISQAKKDQLKNRVKSVLNPEKMSINNLDEIIRNNLHKFKNDMDYYKFILFFTTFNDIHSKQKEVVSAFQKAFPDHEINVLVVSSESHKTRKNLELIDQLESREKTIDLIFSVNMLSFGYHVSNITGIMMFRQTVSNIIYSQQVGRCLSVVQKEATIIFDFVENLYKSVPEYVNFSDSSSSIDINRLGLLFPENDVNLDERTQDLLNIDRLINNAITEEFEEEVVNAYNMGLVDIDYCVNKLQLHCSDDFIKVLERYK
jgi:superfamily II DNA or RNA helicase